MRKIELSVGGEMIYLPSVLQPIRHLYSVTSSTYTINRGNTNRMIVNFVLTIVIHIDILIMVVHYELYE